MKLTTVSVLARRPELAALVGVEFSSGVHGRRHCNVVVHWTKPQQRTCIAQTLLSLLSRLIAESNSVAVTASCTL